MAKKSVKRKTTKKKPQKAQKSNNFTKDEEEVTVKVQAKDPWMKVLHWSARGMGLLVLLFWTSFIVISHGLTLASLMEGIVILALAIALLCAWKYEVAGGAIYILLGLTYLPIALMSQDFMTLIIVTTPLIVTGGLFVAEGLVRLKQ